LELLNAKSNTAFDKVRDSALNGEKKKISELMSKIDLLNEDTFFYLNSLNYRIVKLEEIIKVSKMNKNNYEQVIESLKPPVFWKDRPIIIAQLKKWRLETLSQISEKIGETEILMKKNSYLRKDIVIKNLIINITSKASLPNS
jgi:DNA polymerase-3 subunit delta